MYTPVAESLERNPLRLAILPLIQVATIPRLMVRSPECLALSRARSMLVRHRVLNLQIDGENRSGSSAARQVCARNDAYPKFGPDHDVARGELEDLSSPT